MKTKKSKTTTKPNDIATSNTTTNHDVPAVTPAPAKKVPQPAGARVNLTYLRQEAVTSYDRGLLYSGDLTRGGFPPEENEGLKTDLANLDEASAKFKQAREARKEATAAFDATVHESSGYRDQVVAAIRIVFRGKPNPLTVADLKLEKTRDPNELSRWFGVVQGVVETNQAALAVVLGTDPVVLTKAKAQTLLDAIGAQTSAQQRVAALSVDQDAARLKLADRIAWQRYSATIAFPKNKAILRQFVPVWYRKRQASEKKSQSQPTSGGTASSTAGSSPVAPAPVTPSPVAAPAPVAAAPTSPAPVAPAPALPEAAAAIKPAALPAEGKGVTS